MGKATDIVIWRSGKQLGNAVRGKRESMRLTQGQLAKRAGVGLKFLYELESGKDTLRADKVLDVLEVLALRLVVEPSKPAAPGKQTRAAWLRRNRAALNAYNEHVEKHGVFSEGLRSF